MRKISMQRRVGKGSGEVYSRVFGEHSSPMLSVLLYTKRCSFTSILMIKNSDSYIFEFLYRKDRYHSDSSVLEPQYAPFFERFELIL